MKILSRSQRKIYLSLLGIVLLFIIGLGGYRALHKANTTKPANLEAKYISLGGSYLFSIPDKYAASETAIAGVTIVYPEDLSVSAGKNLEELYTAGVVAVQPIAQLKDNNAKAFKDYINTKLAADLRKALNSASDVREFKRGNVDVEQVFAINEKGNRLRAIYALNFSQPVIIAANSESEPFKIIASTAEDLKKSKLKPDIDQAAQATKTVVAMLQKQDISGIRGKSTTAFNKSVAKDKLKTDLESSANYLSRSITIVGGSYDTKIFVAQLVFAPKIKDQTPASGLVALRKDGESWKLDGLQLPK